MQLHRGSVLRSLDDDTKQGLSMKIGNSNKEIGEIVQMVIYNKVSKIQEHENPHHPHEVAKRVTRLVKNVKVTYKDYLANKHFIDG